MISENRILRETVGPKREEVRGWIKLHDDEDKMGGLCSTEDRD
jgi:hypothetical protein